MRTHRATIVVLALAVAAPAAALAARIPTGRYQTLIGAGPASGTWILAFRASAYTTTWHGKTASQGTALFAAGNRLTFQSERGPLACRGSQAKGTYRWKLTGRTLTFTRIADSCAGRRLVLSRPFKRLP